MLETYFSRFRKGTIGIDQKISTPYRSDMPLVYADWTASGRSYAPIENRISQEFLPLVANTHTDTTTTGMSMTHAYHHARQIIKKHVNASSEDLLITCGTGMTGAVNKLQRILGFKVHPKFREQIPAEERPVVFVTHMEHHSNQTSWMETIADVVIIPPDEEGLCDPQNLLPLLEAFKDRSIKIAAVTSCSNVTGILTDYYEIAGIMHDHGGYCFVDFACSAPYIAIDMHPNERQSLDAIYFSPHKFLGGPGSSGVLVFNKGLYNNPVPDHPGGGTVYWTNPWGNTYYIPDIEIREDGGTPGFLQAIRTALAIRLKEEMGSSNILQREEEMLDYLLPALEAIPGLTILAGRHKHRLGVISFTIDGLNYNLGVKLLNDLFGIQTRGGCSCAGTYGHYLLNIDEERSSILRNEVERDDHRNHPGWIRLSIHPTMTNDELHFIVKSIDELARNYEKYLADYTIDMHNNIICNRSKVDESNRDRMRNLIDEPFTRVTEKA